MKLPFGKEFTMLHDLKIYRESRQNKCNRQLRFDEVALARFIERLYFYRRWYLDD